MFYDDIYKWMSYRMTCSLAVTSPLQIVVIWIHFGRERINKSSYLRGKKIWSQAIQNWYGDKPNVYSIVVQYLYILQWSPPQTWGSPSSASFPLAPPSVYSLTSWSNDGCSSSSYHAHIPSMQRSEMPSPSGVTFHKTAFSCVLDNT